MVEPVKPILILILPFGLPTVFLYCLDGHVPGLVVAKTWGFENSSPIGILHRDYYFHSARPEVVCPPLK